MKIHNRQIRIPVQAELPLLFAILYLPAYLAQGTGFPVAYFDRFPVHIQIILTSLLYSLLILYLLGNIASPEIPEWERSFAPFRIADFTLALAGLSLIYFLTVHLSGIVLESIGSAALPEEPILLTKKYMLIPTGLTCLFSAAQEELFFRVYGYFRLRQSGHSPLLSMIVMSLLFSAGHAYEGGAALFYAFAAGLFLAERIRKGTSLFSLIPAHAFLNFLIILLNYLKEGASR